MIHRIEKWLCSLVAHELVSVVAELNAFRAEVRSSLTALQASQAEALRLLALLEQATPASVKEAHAALADMREKARQVADLVHKLHPSTN